MTLTSVGLGERLSTDERLGFVMQTVAEMLIVGSPMDDLFQLIFSTLVQFVAQSCRSGTGTAMDNGVTRCLVSGTCRLARCIVGRTEEGVQTGQTQSTTLFDSVEIDQTVIALTFSETIRFWTWLFVARLRTLAAFDRR